MTGRTRLGRAAAVSAWPAGTAHYAGQARSLCEPRGGTEARDHRLHDEIAKRIAGPGDVGLLWLDPH